MKILNAFIILSFISIFSINNTLQAQSSQTNQFLKNKLNVVTTAVPFLTIAPDSRAGGMADIGVASSPDANSMHWNPAKYAFIDKDFGFSLSYSPWLRKLVNDMSLAYLSAYNKIDEDQTIAASLLYFDLGEINFTDISGNEYYVAKPNEMALDVCYSRKLSPNFSGGIALRYIRSNLTDGITISGSGTRTRAGNSVAADISAYYQNNLSISGGDDNALFAFGVNISNIGNKISYTENLQRDFIPTTLRLGPSFKMNFDDYNSIMIEADINKLLVPSPPQYKLGTDTILRGKNPNVSVVQGIFQSFNDAPDGFKEELREINYAIGLEYWYDNQFAIRTGYFHEHPTKGNRKFFTIGLGLKYNIFGIDLAYLIPVEQQNPLENTLTFTLSLDFSNSKNSPVNKP